MFKFIKKIPANFVRASHVGIAPKVPTGTIKVGDNLYVDSGEVFHKIDDNNILVEIPQNNSHNIEVLLRTDTEVLNVISGDYKYIGE